MALAAAGAAVGSRGLGGLRALISGSANEVEDVAFGARRGALFVPSSPSASDPCPLILLFDPGGGARNIVTRYAQAAAKLGWIAASCSDAKNGSDDDADADAMMDLLAFVRTRRAVDASRIFAGGFSGGACGAYRLAIVKPDVVAGAVVECGHMGPWRKVGDLASSKLRFYLFTREQDFNRPATQNLKEVMAAKGCRVTEVEAPGGHAPIESGQLEPALSWLIEA